MSTSDSGLFEQPHATEAVLKTPPTIEEALAAKYCSPHYITLFEVRDSTSFDSSRSADAITVSLYRSRGREITGFEIKKSRSDWLRELKQPDKAEEIGKFCDWFFLVTNDEAVAKVEEIPGPWGYMVLKGEKFKVVKKAERLTPAPIDRHFLCSLLYSTRKDAESSFSSRLEEAVQERLNSHASGLQYQYESAQKRSDTLEKQIEDFETASGLSIRWGNQAKIGEAVKRFMAQEDALKNYRRDIQWLTTRAKDIAYNLQKELDDLGRTADPSGQREGK